MGFYVANEYQAVVEEPRLSRKAPRRAIGASGHLATLSPTWKTNPPKKRVWNFFSAFHSCTGFFAPQPVETHRKKRPTPTKTASGRPNGNLSDYINASGTVVAHREYDAFGNTIGATGSMVNDFNFWFSTKYLDQETGLYYYGYRYYSPTLGRWLSRDPLGDSAFLSQYSRGKSRQEKLRLLRRSVDPAYVYVWNSPIGRFDPFGLWPWSRYEEDGNADGSTTITIKKNCTVVVLFGHGLSTKPHSFKFDKPCTAGGFVGCDAGSTNTKIPEGNRIDDAKLTDGELSSGGASGSLPEEEQFGYWLDKAKEGARSKAKAFCKDKSCCCKKVVIYGELAGSAWDMENWAMPGGWDETINCDEVE